MAQGKSRTFIKTFLNVPRWLGVSQLAAAGSSIKSLAVSLVTVKQPKFQETFEEAVTRMGLSEEELAKKQKICLITAIIYLVSSISMFGYMFYLFYCGFMLATVSAAALTVLLAAFFFKEHFWYTQIKNKRLGFTAMEWFKSLF